MGPVDARPEVTAFAVQATDGPTIGTPTGASAAVRVHGESTGGAMSVVELWNPPRDGPNLHVHSREDELWCVVDGVYRFKAGDSMFTVPAGGLAFGPRGLPHAFQNIGDTPGRLLIVTTPGGLDRFFEDFGRMLPGPVSPERLSDVGRASGLQFVGPPLELSDPM